MAISTDELPRWVFWFAGALLVVAGVVSMAWVTGGLSAAAEPGTCFGYEELAVADGAAAVPCADPHTAQFVTSLAPSLDHAALQRACRAAVLVWLAYDARRSEARMAFRPVVVPVQAAWRRSGSRCDVVRMHYSASGAPWSLAAMTGSAQGALRGAPAGWVQCRRLNGHSVTGSAPCVASAKKAVEFGFTVATKGGYSAAKARDAATRACFAAAGGEVGADAKPVVVEPISRAEWASGNSESGRCSFATKVWRFAAG